MATQYRLVAEIKGDNALLQKIWAWGTYDNLPEEEQERLCNISPGADENWIGFIPAVLDKNLTNIEGMAWKSFCDGVHWECDDTVLAVYWHGAVEEELWQYLADNHEGITSIRVFADGDYEMDVAELGEDDLFTFTREG